MIMNINTDDVTLINHVFEKILHNYISSRDVKIFGDDFIGYRAQLTDGSYDDVGLFDIYHQFLENVINFNEFCFKIRSGEHNW